MNQPMSVRNQGLYSTIICMAVNFTGTDNQASAACRTCCSPKEQRICAGFHRVITAHNEDPDSITIEPGTAAMVELT